MNNDTFSDTLRDVIMNVLQQTAFLFPEIPDLDNGIDLQEARMLEVSLSFSGHTSGRVSVLMTSEFCSMLHENIVGEAPEEEVAPEQPNDVDQTEDAIPQQPYATEQQTDAGKEIVNIVAGQLLTEIYGAEAVFDLTAPEVAVRSQAEFFDVFSSGDSVYLTVEGQPVVATLKLQETVNEHQGTGC